MNTLYLRIATVLHPYKILAYHLTKTANSKHKGQSVGSVRSRGGGGALKRFAKVTLCIHHMPVFPNTHKTKYAVSSNNVLIDFA